MKTHKVSFALKLILVFQASSLILAACNSVPKEPMEPQEELLQSFEISQPEDFALQPTCRQVEIYANIAAKYLDIDHATAIVPRWMNDELADQPEGAIAVCIVDYGYLLLNRLTDAHTTENENRVFQIHTLIYKADELKIVRNNQVEQFVLSAMCDERLYYRGRIATLYYAATQTDFQNFPLPTQLINRYCN